VIGCDGDQSTLIRVLIGPHRVNWWVSLLSPTRTEYYLSYQTGRLDFTRLGRGTPRSTR